MKTANLTFRCELNLKIVKKNFYFIEPLEDLDEVQKIIVHHTSRTQMNAEECHEFHQKVRGWSGIGYNFFIEKDGTIVEGRGFHVGAHAYGHNRNSIGICLTGDFDIELPTSSQFSSFLQLCHHIMRLYNLEPHQVIGHRELAGVKKSCPGLLFNVNQMRDDIKGYIHSSI